MNGLFVLFGLQAWKPVIAALLLPPVPLLLLVLIGARMILWRRGWGWLVVLLSVAMLWLSACEGTADWLQQVLSRPPAPLNADDIAELKHQAKDGHLAIVVLGGGRQDMAPEYDLSSLHPRSLERLRYGLWLSRQTGIPVAFSGGTGYAQTAGTPEADIAARIAAEEFNRPIKWVENQSRDTRENAAFTMAVLRPAGITKIVLVTHGFHMRRALRDFRDAASHDGDPIEVVPAPMGLGRYEERPMLRWMPCDLGYVLTRNVLRDGIGLLMGA
jgi:uncharacterized SAM-binding protein YcdF (DUF218 family)